MLKPLRPKQIEHLAHYMKNPRTANLSDPATGKTASLNMWMYYLWAEKKTRSVFAMPGSLFTQNKASFFKFTHFKPEDIAIVIGTPEKRKKIMESDAKVFIVSFDFFKPYNDNKKRTSRPADFEYLKQVHPDVDCCVVDEFHMGYANFESMRTKWWINYVHKMFSVVMATGTEIDGKLSTVYPIIHIIEPRYYYNYRAFLNEHAIMDEYKRPMGWVKAHKVKAILEKHCVRATFEEVHGEEKVEVIVDVCDMSPPHRQFYKDFEETNSIELEKEFLDTQSGGEVILRARQILHHPETFEKKFELGKDEKIKVHIAAAIAANKRLVIFSPFIPEQERLVKVAQKMGARAGLINGTVAVGAKRDKVSNQFINHELDVLVASPATVGVGFDWNFIDIMVFTTLDYKDSSFVQGYRRGVRGEREKPLIVYVLKYKSTMVEARTFKIIEEKMQLAAEINPKKRVFNFTQPEKSKLTTGKMRLSQL